MHKAYIPPLYDGSFRNSVYCKTVLRQLYHKICVIVLPYMNVSSATKRTRIFSVKIIASCDARYIPGSKKLEDMESKWKFRGRRLWIVGLRDGRSVYIGFSALL